MSSPASQAPKTSKLRLWIIIYRSCEWERVWLLSRCGPVMDWRPVQYVSQSSPNQNDSGPSENGKLNGCEFNQCDQTRIAYTPATEREMCTRANEVLMCASLTEDWATEWNPTCMVVMLMEEKKRSLKVANLSSLNSRCTTQRKPQRHISTIN